MQEKPKRSESLIKAQKKYSSRIKSVCIHFKNESELHTYDELCEYAIRHNEKISESARNIIKDGLESKGYF